MLNCRLKVISPYNHGSSKWKRQIKTISQITVEHLWDKGQMWPLFATTAAYAMNAFASEALSGFSPFQLVFLRDPPDLTSLTFPNIDTFLSIIRILLFVNSKSSNDRQIVIRMENPTSPRI